MKYWVLKNLRCLELLSKYSIFILLIIIMDCGLSDFFTKGLIMYFGLDNPVKVLLVGHSHTVLGLDKETMEKQLHCKVAKYAIEGANAQIRHTMIQHFLHQNRDSLKLIVYDVDAFFLTGKGLSINEYELFYPLMDDPYIDEYIRTSTKDKLEYNIKKYIRTSRFTDLNINKSVRGCLGFYSNLKIGNIDTIAFKARIKRNDFLKITFDPDLKSEFEKTLALVSSQNIKLVLLVIPTIGLLNRAEPAKYKKAIEMLKNYSHQYKNVYFINYNDKFENDYDLFYDPIHLNPKGNKIVTQQLIDDFKNYNFLKEYIVKDKR